MTKFQVAVITLLIGFVLGQSVDYLKYKWSINRKKKALGSEIDDLAADFHEKITRIEQIIKGIDDSGSGFHQLPRKLYTTIYDKHYAEVAPFYERIERKSIYIIYSHAENFNEELIRKDRKHISEAKKSLFSMYVQCMLGYGSAISFKNHKGKKLPIELKENTIKTNKEIQKFEDKDNITS